MLTSDGATDGLAGVRAKYVFVSSSARVRKPCTCRARIVPENMADRDPGTLFEFEPSTPSDSKMDPNDIEMRSQGFSSKALSSCLRDAMECSRNVDEAWRENDQQIDTL